MTNTHDCCPQCLTSNYLLSTPVDGSYTCSCFSCGFDWQAPNPHIEEDRELNRLASSPTRSVNEELESRFSDWPSLGEAKAS